MASPPTYRDAADLADQIARKIWEGIESPANRDRLAQLLTAFAAEIKRSAIEP